MNGFFQQARALTCDAQPLDAIARSVGTPCYVYSGRLIRDRFSALASAFAPVPHALHYALKANSTLAIVRLLRGVGAQADANSVGEIDVALRAGFIPEQIVFTGVGKTPDELARAVALGVKCINAESRGEMERIDAIARAQATRARVALRVNPDIDANTHAHISTGTKRNKFGVALEEAATLCRALAGREGLEIVGIHAHIGSQITTLEPLERAARALSSLAHELAAGGLRLEHLDVGGGLGIAYDGGDAPSPDAYARAIIDATRDAGLSLIVEPGRTVVGPAGVLLATVVDVKVHPGGRRFVVLDAGMTELIRPALYDAFHRIVPVVRDGRPDVACDIVGPVCESSDTFGVDRRLPDPRPGDVVAVLDAGAYGSVMASNYNRRPQPPEALVDEGAWRVVKRRQTVDEMLACEE